MSSTTCPVFRPTLDEFKNFSKYIRRIEKNNENIGICKIIPPLGWFNRSYDISSLNVNINNPVKQLIAGRAGVFNLTLLEISPMSLNDMFEFDKKNTFECNDYSERERRFWKSLGCASVWDDPIYVSV